MSRFFAVILLILVWPARFVALRLNRLAAKRTTRNILAIQLAGLGDTLMLMPALAALRNQYPDARIDLITLHEYVRDAFRDHPLINEIGVLAPYSGKWIISRFANLSGAELIFTMVRYYPDLILKLAFRRYDLGINFGVSDFDQSLGNALMFCLDLPVRIGLTGGNEELLSHRTDVKYRQSDRVSAYLSFLKPLGISTSDRSYQFPVTQSEIDAAGRFLNEWDIDRSRPLAVIHPGGKLHINSRRWPAQYFARLCSFLSQEGFEIVLTGDREDADVCDEIASTLGRTIATTAGHLNFRETAALLKRAEVVITNDTATLHLAEAVQVPRVISIFGPTDPALLAPQNERHIIFRSNLPCAPCMGGIIDANTERCSREVKEECLWQTKPEQVIGILRTLYSKPAVRVAGA